MWTDAVISLQPHLSASTRGNAITLNVKGGGCAGFEYEWGTAQVEELTKEDFVVECDMGTFAVGAHSQMFLLGSTIDYKKDIIGSTFDIQNPNAQSACGCGVSVNFDSSIFG